MKNIIQNWQYQNITPIGGVCLVKSLVMSINVLQVLPTPPNEYFKKSDKMFLDFVCENKGHEMSICEDINKGGLKLISLAEMDLSLKLKLVRKMITSDPEWLDFAYTYKIDTISNHSHRLP